MELRPYQAAAIETVRALWREGQRRVLLVMPTGAGKTKTCEALLQRVRAADWAACVFVAHTAELVLNPADRLRLLGIEHGLVKAGHEEDSTAGVQVCSAATLVRRSVVPVPRADGAPHKRCVLIIDEAHRCRSATYHRIYEAISGAYEFVYVLLMTATPYRRDGRSLGYMADALVEAVTPRELVRDGVLVDPEVYDRPLVERAGGLGGGEDGEDGGVGAPSPKLAGDIVGEWVRHARGLKTVARCASIPHSKSVAERFRAAGFRSEHADGKMPEDERERLLGRLALHRDHSAAIDVLCVGSSICDEGYDSAASFRHALNRRDLWIDGEPPAYEPLACLIDAAPTTSRGAWIQRMGRVCRSFTDADAAAWAGRGLRASPKRRAVVLSHAGNLHVHGFLLQHEGFSLGADRTGAAPLRDGAYPTYRPPRVAECPACFASVPAGYSCPACGHASPPSARELPAEDAGARLERRELTDATPPVATDDDKERYLHALWRRWRERCNVGQATRPEWVSAAFKGRFGHWPDHGMNRAIGRIYGHDG